MPKVKWSKLRGTYIEEEKKKKPVDHEYLKGTKKERQEKTHSKLAEMQKAMSKRDLASDPDAEDRKKQTKARRQAIRDAGYKKY